MTESLPLPGGAHERDRIADPIEIVNIALFLASDMSSYVIGTAVYADGSMRL